MARISKAYPAIGLFLAAAVSAAISVTAQQPRIENGRVTSQPAGTPFAESVRKLVAGQNDVAWIGYAVPVVDGDLEVDHPSGHRLTAFLSVGLSILDLLVALG